jgi:hypothetical protein
MLNRYSNIAVVFVILLFGLSCIKKKEYDNVPAIKMLDYKVFSHQGIADSAYITFSFTDGDGDLGTKDSNSMSMFLKYYEDQGSGFVYLPQFDRSIYLPKLTSDGNNKGIEGTITQIIKPAPIFNIFTVYPYKWEVYVVDRAGNISNVVETGSQAK